MKIEWLDRRLITCMYSYTLVMTEKQWQKALKMAKIPPNEWPWRWASEGGASTSTFEKQKIAIVAIPHEKGRTIEKTYSMLMHEAVHIFQAHCRVIGEQNPSEEFQAYAVQHIALHLMESYRDQTKK